MTDLNYKKLFNIMPEPRLIVAVQGHVPEAIIECNDNAGLYFQRDKNQIIGRKFSELVSSESALHLDQSFHVCITRKKIVNVQILPLLDGQGMRVHKFWVCPVLDKETEEVSFLDVVGQIEIKDGSALQRERDDALMFLASIFEVSEASIIVTDESGVVVRVNDSFLRNYGWEREDVVRKPFPSFLEDVDQKKFLSFRERMDGEIKILRKDTTIANALFSSATLTLSQNRKYLVTTLMDITLRKQMEHSLRVAKEEADAANRAKSTFLANMSHELRTPLNAIIGFSELMMKETFGPVGNEKYKGYLGDIHVSAGHLLSIINEVLDMSKIEAGCLELAEESFDIAEMIRSVCRMMDSRVFSSNIEIIQRLDKELPLVYADYRLLRQALINLIANAVKYSPQGGAIIVSARLDKNKEESENLFLSVRDEGVGISEDKIQRALEPFGQVGDNADMRDLHREGTGLGLPLAKAMIEIHGGALNIESELGKGTKIIINLPEERILKNGKHV